MADPYTEFQKPVADPYAEFQKPQPSAASAPGILDREIPLTSYGNATLSGMQSIGRGVRAAVQGIGQTFDPVRQPGENLLTQTPIARIGRGLWQTGKQALEVPGRFGTSTLRPIRWEITLMPRRKLQGKGQAGDHRARVGRTGALGSSARSPDLKPDVPKRAETAPEPRSRRRPTACRDRTAGRSPGERRRLGETGESARSDRSGNRRYHCESAKTNQSTNTPWLNGLAALEKTFSNQVNPTSDLEAIRQSKGEFLRSQPGEIPGSGSASTQAGNLPEFGKKVR